MNDLKLANTKSILFILLGNETNKIDIKSVKNVKRKIIIIITHQTERTKADHPHSRFQ